MATSPKECVVGFYGALARHDLASARSFVYKPRPSDDVDRVYGRFPDGIRIEVLTEEIQSEQAFVFYRLLGNEQGNRGETVGAYCVRSNGEWLLSADPNKPEDPIGLFQGQSMQSHADAWKRASIVPMCSQRVRLLRQFAMSLAYETNPNRRIICQPHEVADLRRRYPEASILTRENLQRERERLEREQGEAQRQADPTYFPFAPDDWKDKIARAYRGMSSGAADNSLSNSCCPRKDYEDGLPGTLFECPNGGPLSFNINLCGAHLRDIRDSQRTVLVYEGESGVLSYNHEGKAHVAVVYGGAPLLLSPHDAAGLIWKLSPCN